MPSSSTSRRRRNRAVGAVAAVLLLAGAGIALAFPFGPRYEKQGVLHTLKEGATLYSFDSAWRVETLRERDPKSGLYSPRTTHDPALAGRLRSRLLKRLGVERIEEIPVEGQTEMVALRGLGYF